jgi:hypothetical protein
MKKSFFDRLIINITIILILVFVITKISDLLLFHILFFLIVYLAILTIISSVKKIKYITSFDDNTISNINSKLKNPIFDSIDYTVTEKFIFIKNNLKVINYSDIFLLKSDTTFSFGKSMYIYPCVYIVSKEGNYCLPNFNSNSTLKVFNIYDFIIEKNKDVLIDDTNENKNLLKKNKSIILKKNWKLKAKRNINLFRISTLY